MARRRRKTARPHASESQEPSPPNGLGERAAGAAIGRRVDSWLLAILLGALILRALGAINDLWLDEVWSIEIADAASSLFDIVFWIKSDNNHPLNTLWLWCMLGVEEPLVLRLHAIVAGVAAVALAAAVGRISGRVEGLLAALFVASSHFLVHYSSEARGWGLIPAFALAAWLALRSFAARPRPSAAILFTALSVLGLYSNLTFVFASLAFVAWSLAAAFEVRDIRKAVRQLLALHAVPLLTVFALYYKSWLERVRGGGHGRPKLATVVGELSALIGGERIGDTRVLFATLAVAMLVVGLVVLVRRRVADGVFIRAATVFAPGAAIYISWGRGLFERVLTLPHTFLLIVLAIGIGRLYRRGASGRVVATAVVLAFLVLQATHLATLYRYGRGSYREAISYMAAHTASDTVMVIGDQDFRVATILRYHSSAAPPGTVIIYGRPEDAIEWGIVGDCLEEPDSGDADDIADGEPEDPGAKLLRSGFVLEVTYPSSPLSGFTWRIYHRPDPSVAREDGAGSPR